MRRNIHSKTLGAISASQVDDSFFKVTLKLNRGLGAFSAMSRQVAVIIGARRPGSPNLGLRVLPMKVVLFISTAAAEYWRLFAKRGSRSSQLKL